jgi:hypothetical protein
MRMPLCVRAVGMVVISLASFPAMGATMSTSFGVSAVVETKCLVSPSVPSYANLAYALASAPSGLSVSCNFNSPYTLNISKRVASGDLVPVAADDAKSLPIYGLLSEKLNKSMIYSADYRSQPAPATDPVLAKKRPYEPGEAKTDTIVLELTY